MVNERLTITAPKIITMQVMLEGTAPYMQAKFSHKSIQKMREKQEAGPTAKKGAKREARDFEADFVGAQHISSEGWNGVPAASIRNACIDACRMAGFKMTHAKMSIFVEPDGLDATDGQPLIRLEAGKPERNEMTVRNATGVVDIRVRPFWRKWRLPVRMAYDGDQFTAADVANLLLRAGMQVGIGEGRPFSKSSNGLGFGTFRIVEG